MDTRAFLVEKSISLPLVLAAVTLLSTEWTTVAFVVLGQAHFCLAYVYKYAQNGFSKRGILLYVAVLLPIMLFAFLDMHRPLLITATLLFLLHAAWDEIFLVQKKPSLFTTLEIAPAALLYSGLLFDSLYPTSLAVPAALLSVVVLGIYIVLGHFHKHNLSTLSIYFLGGAGFLALLLLSGVNVPYEKLIGAIIFLHYSTWYVRYFMKVRGNQLKRNVYLWRTVAVNISIAGLALVYLNTKDPFLALVFSLTFFHAWTIMHILVSYRKSDYTNSFRLT